MIAALAAAVLATAGDTGAERVAELRHMYQQSCEVRAYGSFDDLCDQLKRQMREAEKAQRAAARKRPTVAGTPQPVAAAPVGD